MAKRDKTTVNAHPLVSEPLRRLQAALEHDFGVKATREDIVGALIVGATPAQLVGMLTAYNRHAARLGNGDLADDDASTPS